MEVECVIFFATRNSLKLKEVLKSFSPIGNIYAKTQKLWSRSTVFAVKILGHTHRSGPYRARGTFPRTPHRGFLL